MFSVNDMKFPGKRVSNLSLPRDGMRGQREIGQSLRVRCYRCSRAVRVSVSIKPVTTSRNTYLRSSESLDGMSSPITKAVRICGNVRFGQKST